MSILENNLPLRIRTLKDVEKLDKKIKEELGIDVTKYRNEEVAENFVQLLVFPKYVVNWVIRPVLISFLIFIIGFFLFDLVHIEYFIYGIMGASLFFGTGLIFGLIFLTWKMKSDMWSIIEYSFSIMKSMINDLNMVSNQINAKNRNDVLALLFKGIIHIITIPILSGIISEKVPFIGGIINRIIKRVMILITDNIKFDETAFDDENLNPETYSKEIKVYSSTMSFATKSIEKVLNFTFRVIKVPLTIGFAISLLTLLVFLYLIN